MDIKIDKVDNRYCLQIGSEVIEIEDFKISSSAQNGTELEVKIRCQDIIMEFATSTTRK